MTGIGDLPRLARSIRHTRPHQLVARLRLLARRRRLEGQGRGAQPAVVPAEELPACAEAPMPIFADRAHLAETDERGIELRFLGVRHPLAVPMEWRPTAWQRGTRLELLNLHYMEYLEALPPERLEEILLDWIDHNPPYQRGYWLDHWNSYALSIRAVVWMQRLARHGDGLSDAGRLRILGSLVAQLRFLEANLELDIGGNHLIKNVKALLWAGAFFAGAEAERWAARGRDLLGPQLDEQILADGMHEERSPAYHLQVFADLLECRSVLGVGPLRDRLDGCLIAIAQVAADLTHPDGLPSLFNDGGLHMTYSPEACLACHAELTGRRTEPARCVELPDAGYFALRGTLPGDLGESYLLADCGPIAPDHLPAHGHGDLLAFEWSLGDERILVDAGVYEYHPGAAREASRATRSHNTVTIDDEDQCEFWSSFRVGRRARVTERSVSLRASELDLRGSHDGYDHLRGAPRHRRHLHATPERIHVKDEITGGNGQPVRARLLLHPDCRVETEADGLRILGHRVVVRLRSSAPVRVETSSWCPDFGERRKTSQLVLELGPAPCRGHFELIALPRRTREA